MSDKKQREIPVPTPPAEAGLDALPGLSLDEIKVILGDNAILITQLAKENQRLRFTVQTLLNRIRELEALKEG